MFASLISILMQIFLGCMGMNYQQIQISLRAELGLLSLFLIVLFIGHQSCRLKLHCRQCNHRLMLWITAIESYSQSLI